MLLAHPRMAPLSPATPPSSAGTASCRSAGSVGIPRNAERPAGLNHRLSLTTHVFPSGYATVEPGGIMSAVMILVLLMPCFHFSSVFTSSVVPNPSAMSLVPAAKGFSNRADTVNDPRTSCCRGARFWP